MRKKCTDQVSIFDLFSNHDIGKELKAMSERLDRHREVLEWVAVDLHLREAARSMPGAPAIEFRNHRRRAKKRARAILYTRGQDKKAALYRDLVKVTMNTLAYLEQAKMILTVTGCATLQLEAWHAKVGHYLPLNKQVIDQTQRRVFKSQSVPADEKVFSLFESHTDIIING